jgi:hypothetical protein
MSTAQRRTRYPARVAERAPRSGRARAGVGVLGLASVLSLVLAAGAQAATPVPLASAAAFSVLGASTVTNTGPTTMSGDLGLYPGTAITGAPQPPPNSTYVNDAVAQDAQSDLTTASGFAAGQPVTATAGTDLAAENFTPGVYHASSSLLFSAGTVTLNAQGDPNAVFIFQIPSSLTTSSATTVLLTNGTQACNVFWEVGDSATLGSNSIFVGTIMALNTINAGTHLTLDGRLLAQTAAVNLDSDTITTSVCAPGTTGGTPLPTTTTTPTPTPATSSTPVTAATPTPFDSTPVATTPTPKAIPSTYAIYEARLARARTLRLLEQSTGGFAAQQAGSVAHRVADLATQHDRALAAQHAAQHARALAVQRASQLRTLHAREVAANHARHPAAEHTRRPTSSSTPRSPLPDETRSFTG